jgi:predicted transcriptional regulator
MNDVIEALKGCGLKTTHAKTLAYLFKNPKSYSRPIEREMDLRQPQVSTALSAFQKKGWIEKQDSDIHEKGRPMYLYVLIDKKKIILSLKKIIEEKINKNQKILEKLKEI